MEELRIGLVGTGAIGRSHIERINTRLQGAKVVACADVNMDFCRSVAEKYGIQAYDSGEEMIASDAVDAVIVTTLDPFHEQYVTCLLYTSIRLPYAGNYGCSFHGPGCTWISGGDSGVRGIRY